MEVVGDGDVDDVDVKGFEEFGVVFGEEFDGGDFFEPFEEFVLEIADGDEFDLNREVFKDKPAAECTGGFAAHESATDDA